MNKTTPQQILRLFQTVTVHLLCIPLMSTCFADEQSQLEEILGKSVAALAPPVQFRIRVRGIETTVSQKTLPNGMLASRTEPAAPSKTVLISLGTENYEVLNESRVVIDKNRITNAGTPLNVRTNEMSWSFIPEMPENASIIGRKMTRVTHFDKEYYRIETKFTSALLEAAKAMPDVLKESLCETQLLLIDKSSLAPWELECVSLTGKSILKYQYLEILPSSTLPDDFFALPSEYKLVCPETMEQYFAVHEELRRDLDPNAKPFFHSKLFALNDPERFKDTIDPKSGRSIPAGMTPEEFDEDVQRMQAELFAQNESHGLPAAKPQKTRTFFLLNLVIISAAGLFFLVRKMRKRKIE